jgi:hypothetical protein
MRATSVSLDGQLANLLRNLVDDRIGIAFKFSIITAVGHVEWSLVILHYKFPALSSGTTLVTLPLSQVPSLAKLLTAS